MTYSTNSAMIYLVITLINPILCLVELPQINDSTITYTDDPVIAVINTLFDNLIRNKTRLKELLNVRNNYPLSSTLQAFNSLKEIVQLTRVDKEKINNETTNFMAAINELLSEDIEAKTDFADHNGNAYNENSKENHKINDKSFLVDDGVLEVLKEDYVLNNYTLKTDDSNESGENNTLSDEFWKPEMTTRRIYHGYRVKIKDYPFMATIQIFNKFHCSGSIIKSDLVITAASCLQLAWNNRFYRENPSFLSVQVGSSFYQGGGENIPVLEVYFHPQYDPKDLQDNLCLLRLIRRLKFKGSRKVKKIHIDGLASGLRPQLQKNTGRIVIVGWGARRGGNIVKNPYENFLADAKLEIYPLSECKDIYSREYVTDNNFCAGFFSKGSGACNRDVGAPGIVGGVLVGVVSFGAPECGTPDSPTVFTKLLYYNDWIESIMEQRVPHIKRSTTTTTRPTFFDNILYHYTPTNTELKITPFDDDKCATPDCDSENNLPNQQVLREESIRLLNKKKLGNHNTFLRDIEKSSSMSESDDQENTDGIVSKLLETMKFQDKTKVAKMSQSIRGSIFSNTPMPSKYIGLNGLQATTVMGMVDPEDSDDSQGKTFYESLKIGKDVKIKPKLKTENPKLKVTTNMAIIDPEDLEKDTQEISFSDELVKIGKDVRELKVTSGFGKIGPKDTDLENDVAELKFSDESVHNNKDVSVNSKLKVATGIGIFDPEDIHLDKDTQEIKFSEEYVKIGKAVRMNPKEKVATGKGTFDLEDINLEDGTQKITSSDESIKIDKDDEVSYSEHQELDKSYEDKSIHMDIDMKQSTPTNKDTNSVKVQNKKMEEKLVDLLDDDVLKQIIDSMPKVEEDKLDKVVKLVGEKELRDKINEMDNSILALLYLTDSEKEAKVNGK